MLILALLVCLTVEGVRDRPRRGRRVRGRSNEDIINTRKKLLRKIDPRKSSTGLVNNEVKFNRADKELRLFIFM